MTVFESNLLVLAERLPELAARLGAATVEISGLEVAESASGRPYLRLAGDASLRDASLRGTALRGTALEDAEDPGAAARASVATIPQETRLVVIKGLGLGSLLKAVAARRDVERIACFEPQVALFALLLKVTDLRRVLADPRFDFLVGVDGEEAIRALRKKYDYGTEESALLVVLPRHVTLRSAVMALSVDAERRFDEAFASLAVVSERNATTLGRFVDLWRQNILENFPAILSSAPVARLAEAGRGRTGILVAAGPSLDRNVAAIRERAGSAVIVCVDTAYRTLRAAGVTPHFVVAVDATVENTCDFDGLDDADGRSALVMVPVVNPGIPPIFRRRFVASYGHPIQHWMEEALGERFGSLLVSGSVATIAYDLLRFLGARPIVIAGMDLAYGATSHTRGVFERVAVDRFQTREYAARRSTRDGTVQREGWGGRQVRTTEQMARWAEWFERELERRPWPTINATEGGVRIKGMPEERLVAALERHRGRRDPAAMPALAFNAAARGRVMTRIRDLLREARMNPTVLDQLLRWESAVRTPAEVDAARRRLEEQLRRLAPLP